MRPKFAMTSCVVLAMQVLACQALALSCTDADLQKNGGQQLIIETTAGARCTVSRDKNLLRDVVVPGEGDTLGLRILEISSSSCRDIIVTCSKRGFVTQSKSLPIYPARWYPASICNPPRDMSAAAQGAYCDEYYKKEGNLPISWEYGRAILVLKRESRK